MHLSKELVNHRSLRLWPAILTAASYFAAGSLLAGCVIVDEHDHGDNHYIDEEIDPPAPLEPDLFTIDTDQTLKAEPGEGVGLFVEYAAGGNWLLWTTCDTNYSNVGCKFDVFASVDKASELKIAEGLDFEGYDEVEVLDNGEAHVHLETASDIDSVLLTTTPGAIMRVELMLDGIGNERFIYWVGDGVLHEGAPTNPIDLLPSSP
jgi:hypothetical protein